MEKIAGLLTLVLLCGATVLAQDQPQATPPAPPPAPAPAKAPGKSKAQTKHGGYMSKYEVSGGYTYYSFNPPSGPSLGMNGWNASLVYNYKWWLGLAGEALGAYNNQGTNGKTTIYNGLIGPTLYPLGHRRLTVFGHALVGLGHYDLSFPPLSPFPGSSVTNTAAGWEVGGGADFYLKRHLAIRVLQVDYDKSSFFSGNASRGNTRISFGIVYRFGER